MAKKKELSLEERSFIQDYAVDANGKINRTVEQMAAVLTRPVEMIQKVVDELFPNLKTDKVTEVKKHNSILQEMMNPPGGVKGVTIMTEAASQVSDDVRGRSSHSEKFKSCIHKPKS